MNKEGFKDMAALKFVPNHNVVSYLCDLPRQNMEFKSLIVGLNMCRIAFALRTNPVICERSIQEFWGTATINGQNGFIEASVQGCKITVSEEVIRSTLLFGDHSDHPISYPNDVVVSVLIRKGYEGKYPPPPLVKKLLHPY
ncbi:hypothetical protein R6Q59_025155 [Mikania micrantha]